MDKQTIIQKLREVNKHIFKDLQSQRKKSYKNYSEELAELLIHSKQVPEARQSFAVALYNLAKLSNRYRYLHSALGFKDDGIEKIIWNLQMLALASSKSSHHQSYTEACILIQRLVELIQGLKLSKQHEMFARQVVQIIQRTKSINIHSTNSLNELEMNRKFQTDCPYINKKFHIADIMVMEPINFQTYDQKPKLTDTQTLFYYIVFLSIACFTRATEKFYCRQSTDRDFHFKAIQIAGYLYSSKSTYLRFLKRTYKEHYLEHLDEIEEVEEHSQLKIAVLIDPDQISMKRMPWEMEQEMEQQMEQQLEKCEE